jgi:hypothetical protein
MISLLNEFNYVHEILINFIAHIIIFIGAFYVALQNRNLKQWHVTPLWYVGLAAFSTCITIVIQWAVGLEHPMSYYNIGRLTETLLNVSVASIAAIMLIGTVREDLKNAKKRRQIMIKE